MKFWLATSIILCCFPVYARALQAPGSITGSVADKTGAAIAGARVALSRDQEVPAAEAISGVDGQFTFPNLAPGPYHLTVSAPGFAEQSLSGSLSAGEVSLLPPTALTLAAVSSDVDVTLTKTEVAEQQIKDEEKQRLLGFVPNFNVSYVPDAVPLTKRQKFKLAFRSTVDPVTFGVTGIIAGVQQARNDYSGYGQGSAGYGKRYGAAYGNFFIGTMMSDAVFPTLFKQDPRYFYKGTGTTKSRIYYAISRTVIRKGDNGKWQPDYSGIFGRLAAGGFANLYYPAKDRNGAALTFENVLISIGADAGANLLQEFLFKRLTPSARKTNGSAPGPHKP